MYNKKRIQMKTRHNFRLSVLLASSALLFTTFELSAQVRIGGRTPNIPGSLLDLNSPTKGTVLFPHIFIDDLDFIPNYIGAHPDSLDVNYNLAGSVVFNTNPATVTGMHLWDGNYWVKINTAARPDPYADCSTLYDALTDNTGKSVQLRLGSATGDTLTFLTYNLGADPSLTPFQQMKYEYTWATTATDSAKIPYDLRVNGGLFQWGRKDFRHAFRCPKEAGNAGMFSDTQLDYPSVLDDGKFVLYNSDWVITPQDSLWDSSISGYTGFNDPCPSGFHVPTLLQWNTFIDNNKICWFNRSGATYINQRYVAIPVQNGIWKSNFTSGLLPDPNSNYRANNGIAIYTDTAYTALTSKGDGIDLADFESFGGTLHEPVLFLPAGGFRNRSGGGVVYTGYGSAYWAVQSMAATLTA
jgi:hypothetical protein